MSLLVGSIHRALASAFRVIKDNAELLLTTKKLQQHVSHSSGGGVAMGGSKKDRAEVKLARRAADDRQGVVRCQVRPAPNTTGRRQPSSSATSVY